MFIKTLTVSSLNNYIKKIIDTDFILNNATVKGEISNFKLHSSGHAYFSLKDEMGKINCVMFKNKFEKLNFIPRDGMNVIVKGRVSVYQKEGTFQLYCESITVDGEGELYIAFQKLKEELRNKGLFDDKIKKTIPKYPFKVGVVTSPTGAAIKDIINVIKRRNKNIEIIIYPVLVQGVSACDSIIKGIEALNKIEEIEVIILARGGGSIEELWAFNEEKLAYTINSSNKPIITGIGHETDFTIADFVSDYRASTPSAAAEIVSCNYEELIFKIKNYKDIIKKTLENMIDANNNKIKIFRKSLHVNNPSIFIVNQYEQIDKINKDLFYKISNIFSSNKQKLRNINSLLQSNSPMNILEKGYTIILDSDNTVISNVDKLSKSTEISIVLKDGNIKTELNKLEVYYGEEKRNI